MLVLYLKLLIHFHNNIKILKNGLHKVARFFYNLFMDKIFVKNANIDILNELNSIGFDSSYINVAVNKYCGKAYKIFNLKPYEANILKQLCLSLGFDCAVSRETVTCNCEKTNAIIFATNSQLNKLIKKLHQQPFKLKELANELNLICSTEPEKIVLRNSVFDWSKPYVMGIVNATPDSFSDGGTYEPIEQAIKLINDGADIIDIGGESTRPDAIEVSVNEEINRVIPVIKEIRKQGYNIPISVDTRNFLTAKLAIEAGADIINDVSGLDYDLNLYDFVVKNNIPTVIMHSDKVPAVSNDFSSSDIVEDVYLSLKNKIDKLIEAGMDRRNIIIDVGIGFGKSKNSNFELLKRLNEFTSLKQPILLGISRKSFIRNEFEISCNDADVPTALYSSMLNCVNIHRVHNVGLTKKYLNYASLIR